MRAALAQHARVAGIRQSETAVLLGDDEAEQAQIPQALNEIRRLRRLAIPALEILLPGIQEAVDRLDHHAEDVAILVAQARIGKRLSSTIRPANRLFATLMLTCCYCAIRSMTRSRTPSCPTS